MLNIINRFFYLTKTSYIYIVKPKRVSAIPLIKIEKKTNGKIEQAKVFISIYCQLSNIKLSKSEITVLAYFIVYKISDATKDLILKSKIYSTEDSLNNTLSKLRKLKLIFRSDKNDILNKNLDISLEPIMVMMIKIDNK